ncbi:MAG TPA: hypothetical protein VD902_10470 [Symbiobacteriaceae bacterium]|nr:hypothetical protein [Symbiobacteriaceae bacterium]
MRFLTEIFASAFQLFTLILPPSLSLHLWLWIASLRKVRRLPKPVWQRRMRYFGLASWLMCSGPRISKELSEHYFSTTGIQHVKAVTELGHGAIIVMVHQIGIRVIPWAIKRAGLLPYWLCLPPGSGLLQLSRRVRYWQHRRLFGDDSLIYRTSTGTRRLYDLLRAGAIVCMAQDLRGDRHKVTLLGQEVSLALGSVRIARATAARLIPAVVVPTVHGLQAQFGAPLPGNLSEEQLVAAAVESLETLIRSAGELWSPQWRQPEQQEGV